MIRIINFILCSIIMLAVSSVQASYTMTELVGTPLDIPNTVNTVIWDNTDTGYPNDDDKQTVAIGFPFQFDNTIYNNVTIFTNGILKFGAIERMHRDFRNEALATDEGNQFIAVYWDDLVDDASSSVTYGSLGTAPNRRFVVNWTNVKAYANNLRYDFQVVLYENGDIRYRYNNNTSNGESATIGLEIDDGDFIEYSFNSVSVEVTFDLLFRNQLLALPTPLLQYRLDEISWDGSVGEVIDSSLNSLDGRSFFGANTASFAPALGSNIGTCNYGEFDGVDDYVEISNNSLLSFSNNFSVGVWIKIDAIPTSDLKTIASKDENYEFHVNSNGKINWWWQTATSNDTRQFNSIASIVAGDWTHVVISFSTGSQKIFINGVESGSATFPENTTTNSDPLQLASDQNSGGRYFKGNIDEVNFFDKALSENQARELMEVTRPCSSINLCVSSFPDGLNSHSNGIITFGRDAQLFFSPDDSLDANSVVLDGASNDRSCVSVECQANGLASDITSPPVFPTTSGSSNNINIGNNSSGASDPSINQYNQIDIGNGSVFTISASYSDYYIDTLSVGNNTELELLPGNYWIRNLDTGATNNPNSGLEIRVIGAGTVRLYINDDVVIGQNLLANSPSQGSQGDASQLMLYGYSNITIERDSTFSGIIYAAADVDVQRDGNVYGSIAGDNISLGRLTNVFFNPSAAANLDYGDLCESASCVLGSFNIAQPTYALACPGTRAQISIQAICDDGTSVKEDYAGTVDVSSNENSLSEFYATLTSVPIINSIIFDGSETGIKDVYLFHQNENSDLRVSATDSTESITSISTNATDFRTEGFAITDPASFICGNSSSMSITAIGEDDTGATCQTLTGFTGLKSVKAWYQVNINSSVGADPVTTDLSIASQLISAQAEPAANNVDLTFNNGVANIAIAYANAGQILGVNFKHDDAPYDGSIPELSSADLSGSTGAFIASPEKINLVVDTANGTCASADASCSKLVPAGSTFQVTAQAQCTGSTLADDYQGNIKFSHSLVAPSPGADGSLLVSSAIVAEVDAGEVQINQSISEVGVFNLTAEADDYFGQIIPLSTLLNVGRFYPNNFLVASSSTTNSCGGFSYMGQTGGGNEIDISYTLQAQKTGGGITLNYKGAFAKATIALVAENNNDGGNYQGRLDNFNTTSWADGEYLYSDGGSFSRAVSGLPDGPYQDLQVGIKLSDNDGNVTNIAGLDIRSDASTDCSVAGDCDGKWLGNNLDLRFGQLKLGNVFGPETFALDMAVHTEYYNGTDFVLNTDDNCTVLFDTDPPLSPVALSWTGNLGVGETTPNIITNITGGKGVIRFDAAGLGNDGSVIFEYDTTTLVSPATDLPWLNTENDDDADYADNPFGKITFGQFRGNDRMIYWREVVR
jgi:MSHA biogenesis protein MshQ